MIDRLENIEEKYNEITKELTKPETLNNVKLLTELSKKQRSLEETVTLYRRLKDINNQITEDTELLKDSELKDIAKEELQTLELEKEQINQKPEIYGHESIIICNPKADTNALKKEYKPNTLCHNDFVQGNILYSDTKDYLIDYEYAAKNDYRFDIASFFSENNIHYIDQRDQFYQAYFDGEIDPMIDVQVQAFEKMEDILWGYWANMLYEQRDEQIYFDIAKDKEKHYRG